MKKIGITVRYEINEGISFVRNEYLDYVSDYFTPVILPMESNDELIKECDCFLVTGGDDINPSYYNEEKESHSSYVDARVDELDKKVIEYALKSKKPLLGICRGIQSLNVFMGGTLIQHISDESHKKNLKDELSLNGEGRYFKKIFPSNIDINSYHHQAIKDLAQDLINVGESRGVIEAVEHKELPILAVQWHPEKLHDVYSKKLIELFQGIVDENK